MGLGVSKHLLLPMSLLSPSTIALSTLKHLVNFQTTHHPRAYVNAFVRFHHLFTLEERLEAAQDVGWNVFQFPSEMLQGGDLLSDSGTTTLTVEQLSAMLLGDEAYGSNWGYFQLLEQFEETFGLEPEEWETFLFHQGRAAEHALFSQLGKLYPHSMVPSNSHFDTTRANIEANGMEAIDLFASELHSPLPHPFKGNMNIKALQEFLQHTDMERHVPTGTQHTIPLVFCTITNNTGGGQPVSLENMKAVANLCRKYGKSFFLDACRFAENTWFIHERENGYRERSIPDIVHETFSLCDGFTISLKKDGLSNMGGALVLRKNSPLLHAHPSLVNSIRDHQILTEGHPSYGGLTGRDIMVIVEGLRTVIQEEYLNSRITQVHEFGEALRERGIPVLEPFGGHAVYIDVDRFFEGTRLRREDFGGVSLTGLLLLKGVRLAELGAFAFGKHDPETGRETFPPQNFVRAAIPRNKYEKEDLLYVADCIQGLYAQRHELPRAVPIVGRDLTLRHFKSRFELKS